MLPQGIFSVAVATVLFPTLSRLAARRDAGGMRQTLGNGMRQINLLLIPSAALMLVLATPITRLVYQRGTFGPHSTTLVSTALFWFSFSLPFAGVNLLLTRTFFALQRPWIPTQPGGDQHDRRRDRQCRALQAARDRGLGDRDRGRERDHDRAAAAPAADRLQRPPRAGADADDHGSDPGRDRRSWRRSRGGFGLGSIDRWARSLHRADRSPSAWRSPLACLLYGKLVLAMRIPEARQIQALLLGPSAWSHGRLSESPRSPPNTLE